MKESPILVRKPFNALRMYRVYNKQKGENEIVIIQEIIVVWMGGGWHG